jgi:GGDEF domain-containing protein
VLDSGAHFAITPAVTGDTPRLAFCSPNRLSRFELDLLAEIAERAVPSVIEATRELAPLTLIEGDQRSEAAVTKLGTMVIDLQVFENVRVAAGQLTAERVVADAIGRLRMLLRAGDVIEQLGEDRLGALIAVSDETQLEAVCARMRATLGDVPVPRRASNIDPQIVYSVNAELSGNPDLVQVLRRLSGERRAAG